MVKGLIAIYGVTDALMYDSKSTVRNQNNWWGARSIGRGYLLCDPPLLVAGERSMKATAHLTARGNETFELITSKIAPDTCRTTTLTRKAG